jgi:uncharacterized protein YprB with RNaseH-like and TPR domain
MTIYFDIETTGFAPSGRITCVVTYSNGRSKVWATPNDDGGYALMDGKTVLELVDFFEAKGDMGRKVVSYNGGSFDFHMLWLHVSDAEAKKRIERLALNHFDLHLACILSRGHRVKLDSIAMASLGKVKTATGANAIEMWNKAEYSELFSYCVNDVELLRDLHELALSENKLTFESKKGNIFTFPLGDYMGLSADEMSKRSPKKEDWMGDNSGLVKVFDWIQSA